jgi:hypothetical protein
MPAFATIVFHDPFPGTNGDVIGDPRSFDIEYAKISLTSSVITIELGFNFGLFDQTSLTAFRDPWSPWLSVGDVLFYQSDVPKFGIPVADHAGSLNGGPDSNLLFAGQMYEIQNREGWMAAHEALNDAPNVYYRFDSPVWLRDSDGSLTTVGFPGFVNVTYSGGDGTLASRYNVTLTVATPLDLYAMYEANQLSFSFASATCGNDIVSGFLDPSLSVDQAGTPEPSSWMLALTGMAALAVLKGSYKGRF